MRLSAPKSGAHRRVAGDGRRPPAYCVSDGSGASAWMNAFLSTSATAKRLRALIGLHAVILTTSPTLHSSASSCTYR